LAIPTLVGSYLCSPVGAMRTRQSKTRRIAVPKIAIDEHKEAMTGENKVGPSREQTAPSPSAYPVPAHDAN